jgi:NADPH:quinone reductase-like Zn-dependent oxidoreductase
MQAVEVPAAGGYEQLTLKSFPSPQDGINSQKSTAARHREAAEGLLVGYQSGYSRRGCVLVRSLASGVNYADACVRWGLYASAKEYVGWPITPGFEFCGVVEEIWDEEESETEAEDDESHSPALRTHAESCLSALRERGITVGSRVFGVTRFGAYATHIVAPGDTLFPLPEEILSPPQAAAFPAVFLTAYYAMFELVHPFPGDVILVHSAAGGVGSALVQLGKVAGATVVGVVGSAHKVDACRAFGADHVIDKSSEDLWARCEEISAAGFAAVYDANGQETLQQSYDHLAPGGSCVVVPFPREKRPRARWCSAVHLIANLVLFLLNVTGKLVVYGFHTMLPKTGGRTNILKLAWSWSVAASFIPPPPPPPRFFVDHGLRCLSLLLTPRFIFYSLPGFARHHSTRST